MIYKNLLAFLCILALVKQIACQQPWIQVDPVTGQFVDENGASRIFHGVNAVYKIFPWAPSLEEWSHSESLNEQDMKDLVSWGFNVVRLGIMWPGVNPSEGYVNTTYLDYMKVMVEKLGDHGIYVMLDFHQDLLSRYFCGEGAPDYLINTKNGREFPSPLWFSLNKENNTGYPMLKDCLQTKFVTYYFADQTTKAFKDLYKDGTALNKGFHDYWSTVASHFKDLPNVLGYDLINEPFSPDIYGDPRTILFPGRTDYYYLQPFYQKLHETIRKTDDNHIIFYEPVTYNFAWQTGFTDSPGGEEYKNRSALSYHVYCPLVEASGAPKSKWLCDKFDALQMSLRLKETKRLGGAGILTEFGALDDSPASLLELETLTSMADSSLHGYIYWTFKSFNDITTANGDESEAFYYKNGTLQVAKVKALSRTYAQIIAGIPTEMTFNPDTSAFSLQYKTDNKVATNETIIYLNEDIYYPNGYTYEISNSNVKVMSRSKKHAGVTAFNTEFKQPEC